MGWCVALRWGRRWLLAGLCCLLLLARTADAQIYVTVDNDGQFAYSSEYKPGAIVYLETLFTARAQRLRSVPFSETIATIAGDAGVDPRLVEAVIAAESAFDPRARSPKGARGLMQLMPETARELGVRDVWDPEENIRGGTNYLAGLLKRFGKLPKALAAYNAGEAAVMRYDGIPPYEETREYVARVLTYYGRTGKLK